jgi:hypothetical protein
METVLQQGSVSAGQRCKGQIRAEDNALIVCYLAADTV